MATATAPAAAPPTPHRFAVADFNRMLEAGNFTADDRVEPLDGQVVDMSATGPARAAAAGRSRHVLQATLGARLAGATSALVIVERLVALADSAGPLPDDLTVVALRCREDAPDLRCREDAPDAA
jgi:hypothetical protein